VIYPSRAAHASHSFSLERLHLTAQEVRDGLSSGQARFAADEHLRPADRTLVRVEGRDDEAVIGLSHPNESTIGHPSAKVHDRLHRLRGEALAKRLSGVL
jgi:hypothetical protein